MKDIEHFKQLESMYLKAPVQKMYPGISMKVGKGVSEIMLPVSSTYFHAGGAVHGSVYFRLLDDSAYFSVLSLVHDNFMVTTSFHIEFLRPVSSGLLIASGKVTHQSKSVFNASSELVDARGKLVALGKGSFMKSELPLSQIASYGSRQ